MRIAIATFGRFHVLDLARELLDQGHDVRFYSYVPRARAARFGLPAHAHVALLPYMFPLVALSYVIRRQPFRDWVDRAIHWTADIVASRRLAPCDILIAMSGAYQRTTRRARELGAKVVVERGSRHILSQKEILEEVRRYSAQVQTVPDWVVPRELASYEAADMIVVPSKHVETSFIERGIDRTKLFRCPYGVDVTAFRERRRSRLEEKTILFVGTWSYRKGADTLTLAAEHLTQQGIRLLHVGPQGDAPIPATIGFERIGFVDQEQLPDWYNQAAVLVLPSREEGLALVLPQAIACGCRVVASTRTGAEDLKELLGGTDAIEIVPPDDVQALVAAIVRQLDRGSVESHTPDAADPRLRRQLGWSRYGAAYSERLMQLVGP
jgi:glycosyltransferase involved in cell wall biosynthesis